MPLRKPPAEITTARRLLRRRSLETADAVDGMESASPGVRMDRDAVQRLRIAAVAASTIIIYVYADVIC